MLVLDVSRWGRFQDIDEAAYYEYHCRKHGIAVEYVAEAFGRSASASPFDSILKQLKRAMAGEYSRELGVKARAGQSRTHLGIEPVAVHSKISRCVAIADESRRYQRGCDSS